MRNIILNVSCFALVLEVLLNFESNVNSVQYFCTVSASHFSSFSLFESIASSFLFPPTYNKTIAWSTYNPSSYFSLRSLSQESFVTGFAWSSAKEDSKIYERCSSGQADGAFEEEIKKFGWLENDGGSYGHQQIQHKINENLSLVLNTTFVKHDVHPNKIFSYRIEGALGKEEGGSKEKQAAGERNSDLVDIMDRYISFFLYFTTLDEAGEIKLPEKTAFDHEEEDVGKNEKGPKKENKKSAKAKIQSIKVSPSSCVSPSCLNRRIFVYGSDESTNEFITMIEISGVHTPVVNFAGSQLASTTSEAANVKENIGKRLKRKVKFEKLNEILLQRNTNNNYKTSFSAYFSGKTPEKKKSRAVGSEPNAAVAMLDNVVDENSNFLVFQFIYPFSVAQFHKNKGEGNIKYILGEENEGHRDKKKEMNKNETLAKGALNRNVFRMDVHTFTNNVLFDGADFDKNDIEKLSNRVDEILKKKAQNYFTDAAAKKSIAFNTKFDEVFQLKSKEDVRKEDLFTAKHAFSNFMGSRGFFFGALPVKLSLNYSKDKECVYNAFVNDAYNDPYSKNKSSDEIQDKSCNLKNFNSINYVYSLKEEAIQTSTKEFSMLSFVSSRTSNSYPVLSNDGFNLLVLNKWQPIDTMFSVISWLNSMNIESGWIPRELWLGKTSENLEGKGLLQQHDLIASAPSLIMSIMDLHLLFSSNENKNEFNLKFSLFLKDFAKFYKSQSYTCDLDVCKTEFYKDFSRNSENDFQVYKRVHAIFIYKIFPYLKRWFTFLKYTQSADLRVIDNKSQNTNNENIQSEDDFMFFRWKGRNFTNNIANGFDGFPRGIFVDSKNEKHFDLQIWITYFAHSLNILCIFLQQSEIQSLISSFFEENALEKSGLYFPSENTCLDLKNDMNIFISSIYGKDKKEMFPYAYYNSTTANENKNKMIHKNRNPEYFYNEDLGIFVDFLGVQPYKYDFANQKLNLVSYPPWRNDGRCGQDFLNFYNMPGECNPYSNEGEEEDADGKACCSAWGWCGVGESYCNCAGCRETFKFEKRERWTDLFEDFLETKSPHVGVNSFLIMSFGLLPIQVLGAEDSQTVKSAQNLKEGKEEVVQAVIPGLELCTRYPYMCKYTENHSNQSIRHNLGAISVHGTQSAFLLEKKFSDVLNIFVNEFVLNEENGLLGKAGVRTLAKSDSLFGDKSNNFRGSVCALSSFLLLKGISNFYQALNTLSINANQSNNYNINESLLKSLYKASGEIRSRIKFTISDAYEKQGYLYEHYDESTRKGLGIYPFTSLSALYILILSEIY